MKLGTKEGTLQMLQRQKDGSLQDIPYEMAT